MSCRQFYASHYLLPDSPFRLIASPLATVGSDFHRYRAAYLSRLRDSGQRSDAAWVRLWLSQTPVASEARKIIEDDARSFVVNPETLLSAELFLSIDGEWRPLEKFEGGKPGQVSTEPRAVLSGTLDQLDLDGATAYVTDCKSGWSTTSVSDAEPALYAALVFAHFPRVERVDFTWEFVRLRLAKPASYTRDDLEWIHQLIISEHQRRDEIEREYREGVALAVDPFAGLCSFCAIRCPLRAQVEARAMQIPPVQTIEDARAVAALFYQAELAVEAAREALRPWADQYGPTDLGGGFVLEVASKAYRSRPLRATLGVLGFDAAGLPEASPLWDVPLDSLTVGNLSGYASAKKRFGLAQQLDAISITSPRTFVNVRRQTEAERRRAVDLPEAS